MSWWGLCAGLPLWLRKPSTVRVKRHECLKVWSTLTVSSSASQPVSHLHVQHPVVKTYGRQRHLGQVFPRGSQSLGDRSAVWDCGRGTHRSLCRNGGAGPVGWVGRYSSGHRRSCSSVSVQHVSVALVGALAVSTGTPRPAVEAWCSCRWDVCQAFKMSSRMRCRAKSDKLEVSQSQLLASNVMDQRQRARHRDYIGVLLLLLL